MVDPSILNKGDRVVADKNIKKDGKIIVHKGDHGIIDRLFTHDELGVEIGAEFGLEKVDVEFDEITKE